MDEEEDDFISFGTPLPELEDESTLRKKAVKELQVRDEKGRQRFHGAFTGGFSAGYFNTVGTKEGWAPSTFVSSRSKTVECIQQNPEDFMDDEDFGEFGIATRKIHTTSNFQDVTDTSTGKRKHFTADQAIPGEAPLKDIVQPIRESIGYEILKKLGWRQGQGIGPRVKKQPLGTKIYGCSPFPDSVVPVEDDPLAMAYTFAPKDTEAMLYQPKANYFGIGYIGLSKESILTARTDPFAPTSTKSWLAKDRKKLTISGQAFGVGAFEDDDEDIYGKDDMSQYDFSDLALRGTKDSPRTLESKRHEIFQDILEGFCLASQPPLVKKQYPAPTLPPDFKPIHLKSVTDVSKNTNIIVPRHTLSASGRSVLLGEKKFQKLSSDDVKMEKVSVIQPQTSPSTPATSATFCPFPNDISKQKRYEEYLRLKKGEGISKLIQPSSMTEWEKQQEIEEFSKASVLFKPLSNALSSRFESRSHLSVEHEVMAALEKIKNEKSEKAAVVKKNLVGSRSREIFEWHPVSLLCKRMNVPNPYPNSSSSGTQSISKAKSVFDHLSFTSEKPHSHEDTSISEIPSSSNSESKMLETSKNMPNETTVSLHVSDVSISGNKEKLSSENKKPSIDFFKDIFENSSSDEENSKDDEQSKAPDNPIKNSEKKTSLESEESLREIHLVFSHHNNNSEPREKNSQENSEKIASTQNSQKKVGFGVFANLDLDALNQRKSTDKSLSQKDIVPKTSERETVITSTSSDETTAKQPKSSEIYGPDLPPNFSSGHPPVYSAFKVESRKQSKYKSDHKHKHHKHKSKKKKKKKSSKRDSDKSVSSSDDFDDIPPEFILEKLKKLQKKKS